MSRYLGPRLRVVRRLGVLSSFTNKTSIKLNPPGQHGLIYGKRFSPYAVRLREKQKLSFFYGIKESQLLNYLLKARKKKGSSGQELLTLLEMRLDNIIYRLGFAPTIFAARQLVTHGHIFLNGRVVNIPSFNCKPADVVSVKSNSSSLTIIKKNLENNVNSSLLSSHLLLDKNKLEATIVDYVSRGSINLLVNELFIIEYYSRML